MQRRQHPRFKISLGAEIRSTQRTFTAATKDVSAGGACVEGPHPFGDGDELVLSLYVVVDGIEESSMPPLQVKATVQWSAENDEAEDTWKYIAGLKFVDITPEQSQWIEQIVARSTS